VTPTNVFPARSSYSLAYRRVLCSSLFPLGTVVFLLERNCILTFYDSTSMHRVASLARADAITVGYVSGWAFNLWSPSDAWSLLPSSSEQGLWLVYQLKLSVFDTCPNTEQVYRLSSQLGTVRNSMRPSLCVTSLTHHHHLPSTVLTIRAPDVYYLAFPADRWLHKWLVYSVYFLESLDTVFLTYDALADFRNKFGVPGPVGSSSSPVQFSWLRMYIFGGIGAFAVLSAFASLTSGDLQWPA
jgi:hypothetical protein